MVPGDYRGRAVDVSCPIAQLLEACRALQFHKTSNILYSRIFPSGRLKKEMVVLSMC